MRASIYRNYSDGYDQMGDTFLKSQAFKLKGRLQAVTVLYLSSVEVNAVDSALEKIIQKAPKLFEQAPLVLDVSALVGVEFDLNQLCQRLRALGLLPIGVQGAEPWLGTVAQCLGLAVFNASTAVEAMPLEGASVIPKNPVIAEAKLVTTPVRSGQQAVSREGDLIVIGAVSHGAELLAANHIHVYGVLRGRALAGILGNRQARIFCQSLEAELLSIAGFYSLSDTMNHPKGPCQIYLQDDKIQIDPL